MTDYNRGNLNLDHAVEARKLVHGGAGDDDALLRS